MDQQDDEQLEEVEDEDQRRRRRPFPVKYLAAITKLITSTVVDESAAAAAFRETLGQDGTDEDLKEEEEEYLKKLEVLVRQRLHELEEERQPQRQQPHDRSIILGSDASTSTSTTDDHSGTSTGCLNEGGHSGGRFFFRKQVLPADNETQVEEEEDQEEAVDVPSKSQAVKKNNELQLRGFVCFPDNALFPRRSYWICNTPEGLVFSNVVDDLYTICLDAANSYFFEGVLEHLLQQVRSRFTHFQTVLSGTFNINEPAVVIEWLREVTDAAINTKIVINDLIVKTPRDVSSKKITRGKLYHPMNKILLVLLTSFVNNHYSRARRVAIKKLKSIHAKMAEKYIEDVLRLLIMHSTARISGTNRAIRTFEMEPTITSTADKYDHIVGREEDTEMIWKHLMSKDKRVQVISLVGMLGTGKTALAHRIYSQYSVVRRFDIFAWAQSAGPNVHFLTDTWSEMLEKTDQMHQIEGEMDDRIIATGGDLTSWLHPGNTFDLLSNHRYLRYLIIIDDITTPGAWDEARRVLPMDTMNGSRILLTTRDTRVALDAIHDQTGSPPPHQLGPLSDSESWELFTMKVRPLSPLPLELVPIGKEIVKKCDGLPFAIEHLADHLLTQEATYDAWFNVLESANKQLDNYHTPWSYILNIIVKDLWLNVKWCLFYFGLFPKKYAIPVRRLIALWTAEGFPVQSETSTLEYRAEAYLQELINRNMVQVTKQKSNGKPKKCCLTNYLREHLSIRGKQTNFASNTSESSTSRSTKLWVRRLADHPEDNRASAMPAPPDSYRLLLSFLSFDYREGNEPGERIRNFLYGGINKGHFEFLRVLDLEGVYKPILPKEMGKLIHLAYLGLRWTYLDTFPLFVGNLINLQTLDVKHTYISTLPGSIWKLRKLRHVYLNECYLDSFVHQPGADYLENLQTLWGIHIDEESSVLEGLNRGVTKITRLGVSCHLTSASQQEAMAKWIFTLELLQSLRFRSKDRLGKLSVVHLYPFTTHVHLSDLYFLGQLEKLFEVDAFPPNLTELTLSASKLKEDPMPTLEKLPNLSILRLYCDSYIGEHMVCSAIGFIRLEVLEIWKLENVKTWRVEEESMPMLKKLEIRSCNNLENLPVGLQQITTLQELKLTDMPMKFIDEVKKEKDKGCYKKVSVCFVDWSWTSDQN